MFVRIFIQIGAAIAAICLFASRGFAQTAPRPTNLQIGKRTAGREIKLPKFEKWAKYDRAVLLKQAAHDHKCLAQAHARDQIAKIREVGELRRVLADEYRALPRFLQPWNLSHSHGISEAWITSATPSPPTERMARSTSSSPKRWVVISSSGKRLEASCAKASSQAL